MFELFLEWLKVGKSITKYNRLHYFSKYIFIWECNLEICESISGIKAVRNIIHTNWFKTLISFIKIRHRVLKEYDKFKLNRQWFERKWNYFHSCGSRVAATSKTERFVIIVNDWRLLTIIIKRSILDVAATLHPLLLSVLKHWYVMYILRV